MAKTTITLEFACGCTEEVEVKSRCKHDLKTKAARELECHDETRKCWHCTAAEFDRKRTEPGEEIVDENEDTEVKNTALKSQISRIFDGNQSECAAALGVTDRSVRNWLAGKNQVPAEIQEQLDNAEINYALIERITEDRITELLYNIEGDNISRNMASSLILSITKKHMKFLANTDKNHHH